MSTEAQRESWRKYKRTKKGVASRKRYKKKKGKWALKRERRIWFKKYYHKNKDKIRSYRLKTRYGITLEDFILLSRKQKNKCASCKKTTKLHIDHDHKTGDLRGLLCFRCNAVLGMVNDDLNTLKSIIAYLKEWLK